MEKIFILKLLWGFGSIGLVLFAATSIDNWWIGGIGFAMFFLYAIAEIPKKGETHVPARATPEPGPEGSGYAVTPAGERVRRVRIS